MNTKSIRFILGWILNIEALLMLLPVATAVVYREEEGVAYALVMAVEIVVLLMNFYIFPQIVALNLKMPQILKNSLILAFVNIKGNLITLAFYLIWLALFGIFLIPMLIMLPILPLAWLSFLTVFNCYPAIQKYIINPFYEQQGLRNPELPEENDDEEDVIFEDRGGEEAPMVIKKQDKGGKVIK